MGFRESSIWVKALAARLLPGKDVSSLLQEQEKVYKAGIGKYAPHLSGKRVLLVSYTEDISWVLDTIRDLGMEILKVGFSVSTFRKERPDLLSNEGFPVERNYTDEMRLRMSGISGRTLFFRVMSLRFLKVECIMIPYPSPHRLVPERA